MKIWYILMWPLCSWLRNILQGPIKSIAAAIILPQCSNNILTEITIKRFLFLCLHKNLIVAVLLLWVALSQNTIWPLLSICTKLGWRKRSKCWHAAENPLRKSLLRADFPVKTILRVFLPSNTAYLRYNIGQKRLKKIEVQKIRSAVLDHIFWTSIFVFDCLFLERGAVFLAYSGRSSSFSRLCHTFCTSSLSSSASSSLKTENTWKITLCYNWLTNTSTYCLPFVRHNEM